MCTLLTLDKSAWDRIGIRPIQSRITADWHYNSDGGSLVFLDPEKPEANCVLRTMSLVNLQAIALQLMSEASSTARIFLHLRAATTGKIGLGYTHGFDDGLGVFYMHNGVISNWDNLAVDSFNLSKLGLAGSEKLWEELYTSGESFANLFRIDSNNYTYSIIRLEVGSLLSDGDGNYSTNPITGVTGWGSTPKLTHEQYQIGTGSATLPRVTSSGSCYSDLYLDLDLDLETDTYSPVIGRKLLRLLP